MPDTNTLFAAAMTVNIYTLVPGLPYLIMYAQKIVTANSVWLILKLRTDPINVFVKMPAGNAYLFTDSQISRINNEDLFVNMSFWDIEFWGSDYTYKKRCQFYAYIFRNVGNGGYLNLVACLRKNKLSHLFGFYFSLNP